MQTGEFFNFLSNRFNCEKIWQEFEKAVVRRSPCDVRVKDYQKCSRSSVRLYHVAR